MGFDTISPARNYAQHPELKDPVILVNLPITEAVEFVKDIEIDDYYDLFMLKIFYFTNNNYLEKVWQWEQRSKAPSHESKESHT